MLVYGELSAPHQIARETLQLCEACRYAGSAANISVSIFAWLSIRCRIRIIRRVACALEEDSMPSVWVYFHRTGGLLATP